jgi:hypothetical protein
MDAQHDGAERGRLTRRDVLCALARWTVPTVLTLSLGARAAHAAASCPPCTRNVGGVCRACTVSQILNCQCEPCLGPPYCTGTIPTSPFRPVPSPSLGGGLDGPAPAGQQALETWLRQRAARERGGLLPGFGARGDSSFGGMGRAPFGRATPQHPGTRGLYERLRQSDGRRGP